MKLFNPDEAAAFLASQGVAPAGQVRKVMSGFDAGQPMYEHAFWPGDILYQFIRRTAVGRPSLDRGSWYGLAGVTRSGVAIHDGLAGRVLHKFEVLQPFTALEGIAGTLPIEWENEIGGAGGSTQIFVPFRYAGRIGSLGPAQEF